MYSIGKFAKIVGVTTTTLRNWEKQGKLIPHHRTEGGQRIYTEEQAEAILGHIPKKRIYIDFVAGEVVSHNINEATSNEIEAIKKYIDKYSRSSND